MTRWEWVVKVLSENANEELPSIYKKWLFENSVKRNIRVNLDDCVCNELEWTNKYSNKGLLFVQDDKVALYPAFIDSSKPALVLVAHFYEGTYPCYFAYWYNPNIEVLAKAEKAKKVSYKVRRFNLPTFEEWQNKNKDVEIKLGAYRVEIRKFCWGTGYTEYGFAMALANCNALNVYTDKLFSSYYKYKYKDDINMLKQWYNSTVATFYDFWEQYINAMYLEPDV